MELKKEHWNKKDIEEFHEYLMTFSKGVEKGKWERRIVNTQLKCIAVPSPIVKKIINEIFKGNYKEFLDENRITNFTELTIHGGVICKIKDFELMKKYLDKYLLLVDNWAGIDQLKFDVKNNKEKFFQLSEQYLKSDKPFIRRCALIILFKLVDDDQYIYKIFNIMNSLYEEKEYYVNMANAWLCAECFTKQREKTLKFLKTHNMNAFTINKAIQKCRDSFRISAEDKQMLLQFKKVKNGK